MINMLTFCRSLLFRIAFPMWTYAEAILLYPLLLIGMRGRSVAWIGHVWAAGVLFLLKYICGIRYEIRGKENIPDRPVIFACKHQSAWETAVYLFLHDDPCYVLKKQLLNVPLFGRYLKHMNMIAIDRQGGSHTIKQMSGDTITQLALKRHIVIFPEGTRTAPDETSEFHPGVAFLYKNKEISAPVIPVALNSGLFWSNKRFLMPSGTIVMEYLPPIEQGLDRKGFMARLEQDIQDNSHRLMREGKS